MIRKRTKEFLRRRGLWNITSNILHFRRNRINPSKSSLDQILDKYSSAKKHVFFIQIGSNDCSSNDPLVKIIKKNSWSGILVEPMKEQFNQLCQNYSGQQDLIFENSAISSDFNGEQNFYYLEASSPEEAAKWPSWYTQLGSFMPEIIEKHEYRIPNIKQYVKSKKINCLTLSSLLNKYGIKQVDLLCIDAEGYDYEIIKKIDFSSLKPDIIIYEPIHLKNRAYAKCNQILKIHNYKLYWDNPNVIAINYALNEKLNI